MGVAHGSLLLVYAVVAIAALILLIARYKVYPFLVLIVVSLLLGLAVGSATVAMTTASGIVVPIAAAGGATVGPELLVLATGSGSLIFSHVNDGGFWLIKEYFGMIVGQTFKTWSLCETLISLLGLGLTFALAAVTAVA